MSGIKKAEYKGEEHSLFEWAKITGMSYQKLTKRYDNGDRGEALFREHNIFNCKICGKEFITDSNIRKCCSEECKKINAKINGKIWADKQKTMQPKPKKKEKKDTVTDIAVKARELGMSYGQYTAMLWLQERKVQREG